MRFCNKSSIHNFSFFSEKVVSSESGEKHAHIKNILLAKTVLQYKLVDFDVRGQNVTDFVTVGCFIMDYELLFWPERTV